MLYLGADHRGYLLKEEIKKFLETKEIDFCDLGNLHQDDTDDYPDFAFLVAEKISHDSGSKGILICGSGLGMSLAANKFKNVRATAISSLASARMSREHNDANILCLGADFTDTDYALNIVFEWLNTPFSNKESHLRRLQKIFKKEEQNFN